MPAVDGGGKRMDVGGLVGWVCGHLMEDGGREEMFVLDGGV